MRVKKEHIKNLFKNNYLEFNDHRINYNFEEAIKKEKLIGNKILG
jgi:hypothetical protein